MRDCDKIALLTLTLGLLMNANSFCAAQMESPLTLSTSDKALLECFTWARSQAMTYARQGDPVGPWYEAALPGRKAFCMRDVSHQTTGAHALGLAPHTLNMLQKFAVNISESKDWCTYWEINRDDKPAPVDYQNDKDFWYNLPANFDVLNACYRMYLWTGDRTYIDDPAFLSFYEHTVTDYVDRWDLGLDTMLTRERLMNRHDDDRQSRFGSSRGIPSYDEGGRGQTKLGIDLPAFQVAAYRSYARILGLHGRSDEARAFDAKAAAVTKLIEERFWDADANRFNELLRINGQYTPGGGMQVYLLHNDALASTAKAKHTLEAMLAEPRVNIEMGSHYPDIFYRYGAHERAYQMMLDLSDPKTQRREYPEVSFAVVGAIVTGLMGIEPHEAPGTVVTHSRLTDQTDWARISSVSVGGQSIDVRHSGRTETTLTNRSDKSLTWIAQFEGHPERLWIGDKSLVPSAGAAPLGSRFAWIEVQVAPGDSATVTTAAPR